MSQKLDDYFWIYFNSRHSYRVKIDPTITIKVFLEREEYFAHGRLLDISIGGIGLEVDIMVAQRLDPPEELMLSFQLPGCETIIKLAGSVCYCNPIKNIFRYGIKFDRSKTKNFLKQETIISNYVMRRQVEMARIN